MCKAAAGQHGPMCDQLLAAPPLTPHYVIRSLLLLGASHELREGVIADASALQAFTQGNSGDGDKFYANLYLGLYGEATGDAAEARKRISQSVAGRYAQGPGASDPMVELAKVHLQRRGWVSGKSEL